MIAPILRCATPEVWVRCAVQDLDTLLLDHAHCEKKAAGTMMSLIFRWSDHEAGAMLSRMVREEMTHFELVLRALKQRGRTYERQVPSSYGEQISKGARKKVPEEALLDAFVVSALVEARSCERMRLLAEHVGDASLVSLYHSFEPAEDRHWQLMLELAHRCGSAEEVAKRLDFFARQEEAVVLAGAVALEAGCAPGQIRMHS